MGAEGLLLAWGLGIALLIGFTVRPPRDRRWRVR